LENRRASSEGERQSEISIRNHGTRFWIAQQVETKNIADVRPLFAHAKEITGKRPNALISDGAPNFHDAFALFHTSSPQQETFVTYAFKVITTIRKWSA
jgi:hypothetical protein